MRTTQHLNQYILQKKAVRLICNAGYRDHSAPLFHTLRIRTIFEEIEHRQQILAFDVVKNPSRYNLNIQTEQCHEHETRFSRNNLPIGRYRTDRHGTKGIRSMITKSYNSLPANLKCLDGNRLGYVKRKLNSINAP